MMSNPDRVRPAARRASAARLWGGRLVARLIWVGVGAAGVALASFAGGVSVAEAAAPRAAITKYSAGLNGGGQPWDVAAGPDGNVWFTDTGSGSDLGNPAIGRITPSGAITEYGAGLSAGSTPLAIVAGPDGNVWFTDFGRDASFNRPAADAAIGRITPSGEITEYSIGHSYPGGIAAGADGNLWFAVGRSIARITPSGEITEYRAGLTDASAPGGIAAGPDGNLWFTDAGDTTADPRAIGRITPSGEITEYRAGLNAGNYPGGIAAGPDGNLWFTETSPDGHPAIGRVTPSGAITEYSAGLNAGSVPTEIARGADGNLWFTDQGRPTSVGRITPGGAITEYSVNPDTGLEGGIAAGPDGGLWLAAFTTSDGAGAIGRLDPFAPAAPPATGSHHCVVPRLKGKSLPAARKALARARCALGKVRRLTGGRRRGRLSVVRQSPAAGRTLTAGAKVSVTVQRR